jgi:hypothetical protein
MTPKSFRASMEVTLVLAFFGLVGTAIIGELFGTDAGSWAIALMLFCVLLILYDFGRWLSK